MSGDSEILDVVFRELASGRKTYEELYALCAETPLLMLAQSEGEDPEDLLLHLLWDTDRVHVFGKWVMLYAEMLDALDTAGAGPAPDPIDPEVAREIIGRMEDSWLDESVPALGGMTPRDAAADPTRIEDLETLLRTIGEPDPDGAGMNFSSSSLRRKLGLE